MKTYKFLKPYSRPGRGYRAGELFHVFTPDTQKLARELLRDGTIELVIDREVGVSQLTPDPELANTAPLADPEPPELEAKPEPAPTLAEPIPAGEQTEGQFAQDVIHTWKNDPALRDEFGGDFNRYRAWREHTRAGRHQGGGNRGQQGGSVPASPAAAPGRLPTDADFENEWRNSPSIREEFREMGTYQAFRRAETGQLRHPLRVTHKVHQGKVATSE